MNFHRCIGLALVVATASLSGVAAAAPTHEAESAIGERRIVVHQRPPEHREERVTVRPSARHVWRGGYWRWQNRWVWSRGGWVIPPRPAAVWLPGHWDETPEGWAWEPGHWS